MSVHRVLALVVLASVGLMAATSSSSLAAKTPPALSADLQASTALGGQRAAPSRANRRVPAAPRSRAGRLPRSKPPARKPTKRPGARRSNGLRFAFTGRPVNQKGPSIEGVLAIGNTARLNAGVWTEAERYWVDVWRFRSSTGWVLISRNDLGAAKTKSLVLGSDWGDSYIGFHAFAYNSGYGWSDAVWSDSEYVSGRPVPLANPRFDGIVQIGNTVNLSVGAWSGAERYWIEIWRYTSAGGWVFVTNRDLGTARSMPLYLGTEWRNSWIGFNAWGYNAAYGWSVPEWAEAVFVQPENAGQVFDRIDTPAVVRNESGAWGWWLSNDFNAGVAHYFRFQSCCSTPLVGDWDGDGIDSPGVNVGGNRWILGNGYEGAADWDFYYGVPGDVPLAGDWDGDGDDTIAIRRQHCFYWKNSLAGGNADNITCFGNPDDKPVVGDWDRNGTDTPGVYRNGEWWLNNDFSGTVHHFLRFGGAGDRPVPGDFDGDGDATPGIHRGNAFILSNDLAGTTAYSLTYGNPGDVGVVGDWDSEPTDNWGENDVTASAFSLKGGTALMAAPDYVRTYAPRLVFHPQEEYFPMRAGSYIANSALRWAFHSDEGRVIRGAGVHRIKMGRLGLLQTPYEARDWRGNVLKWKGSRPYVATDCTRPHESATHCPDRPALGNEEGFALHFDGGDTVIKGTRNPNGVVHSYYEYQPQKYVTYWFFFGTSRGVGDIKHQGDWERIAIKLDASNKPTRVALYRHQCEVTYPWRLAQKWNVSSGQVDANGTHPVIFVAKFTHGTYLSTSPHQCEEKFGQPNDTVAGGGDTWNTWSLLANARAQKWYGFGGAWGDVGDWEFTSGPLGPSPFKHPKPRAWSGY